MNGEGAMAVGAEGEKAPWDMDWSGKDAGQGAESEKAPWEMDWSKAERPGFTAPQDYKRLFATGNPLDALEGGARASLEGSFKLAYPDADERAREFKKIAVAKYLANMRRCDFQQVYQDFDTVSSVYFDGKRTPEAAYEEIRGILHPEISDSIINEMPVLRSFTQETKTEKAFKSGGASMLAGIAGMPKLAIDAGERAERAMWNAQIAVGEFLLPGLPHAGKMRPPENDPTAYDPLFEFSKSMNAKADELMKEATGGKTLGQAFKEDGTGGALDNLTLQVVAQAPQVAGQIAAYAFMGGPLSLAFMGGTSAGQEYADVDGNARMSRDAKLFDALGVGAAEVGGEKFSLPLIAKFLKSDEAKKGFVEAIKGGVKGFFREGSSEGATQFAQNAVNLLSGKEGELSKMTAGEISGKLLEGVPDSAIVGGVIGGGLGSAPHLSYAERDRRRNETQARGEILVRHLEAAPELNAVDKGFLSDLKKADGDAGKIESAIARYVGLPEEVVEEANRAAEKLAELKEEDGRFASFDPDREEGATEGRAPAEENSASAGSKDHSGEIRFLLAGEKSLDALPKEEREREAVNLDNAMSMEEAGVPNDNIRLATGWFRSMNDGEWRRELDDSKIQASGELLEAKDGAELTLPMALSGLDEHVKAYPFLARVPLRFNKNLGAPAIHSDGEIWMRPDVPASQRAGILGYEIQHAIQEHEGFARGGNPYNAGNWKPESGKAAEKGDGWSSVDVESDSPWTRYRRLAGEREANDSMTRMGMSAERRAQVRPYGVMRDAEAIVDMGDGQARSQERPGPRFQPSTLVPGWTHTDAYRKLAAMPFDGVKAESASSFEGVKTDYAALKGDKAAQAAFRGKAKELFHALPASVENALTKKSVEIPHSVFRELRNHSADPRTFKIVPAIPALIEKATPIAFSSELAKGGQHVNGVHTFATKATLDGEMVWVKLVAKEAGGKFRLYDVQVTRDSVIRDGLRGKEKAPISRDTSTKPGRYDRGSNDIILQWLLHVKGLRERGERFGGVEGALRELAARVMPGAPVEIHSTLEEAIAAAKLPEDVAAKARAGKRKAGFHYKGKSYIVAENIANEEAGLEAILHEAVGHGGLRALFKGEDFERIIGMLADHYGIERQGDWRREAEERFAKQAQRLAKNPGAFPAKLRQIWTEIKLAFDKFLRSLGLGLRLSDSDVAAIVAQAYKAARNIGGNLSGNSAPGKFAESPAAEPHAFSTEKTYTTKSQESNIEDAGVRFSAVESAPNGKASNLSAEQYRQVRTPEFKTWFGDWEALADLSGFGEKTLGEATEAINGVLGRDLLNVATGISARINTPQRGKILSAAAQEKSKRNGFTSKQHFAIASRIDRLWRHALPVESRDDKAGDVNIVSIKRFAAPIKFAGTDDAAIAYITAKESSQAGHRIYSLELQEIKKLRGNLDALAESQRIPHGATEKILTRILEKVNPENVSKVVDANGEPLVVWHGTNEEFHTFGNSGKNFGVSEGLHFFTNKKSAWPDSAMDYAEHAVRLRGGEKIVVAAYLSIKNPLVERIEAGDYNSVAKFDRDHKRLKQQAYDNGHDGIIIKGDDDVLYAAFDPKQIKSADANTGAFSPEDSDIRFNEVEDERIQLDLSKPEDLHAAAVMGEQFIVRGVRDFDRFARRFSAQVAVPEEEMRKVFDAALELYHEGRGDTRTVADVAALLDDQNYRGTYKTGGLTLRAEDDMKSDPRMIRALNFGDAVELARVGKMLDAAIAKSVEGREPHRSAALRGLRASVERALKSRQEEPRVPVESVDADTQADAEDARDAEAEKAAKEAKKLKGDEDFEAFVKEHIGDPDAIAKEIGRRKRAATAQDAKRRENADFDRYLYERHPTIWKMRHDLAIEKVRPPEGADPYTDSSYISEKAGRTSDEVAAMLGIEEEDLLEALDFDEKDLREASRKEAKAKREAAKPGNYDARTLDEAAKDGLSEADLLREELAGERRRRKGLERVNANVLKSIAYNKRIAARLRGEKFDTAESLKQLERWLNSNVPAELRGKYAKQFVRLAEASPRAKRGESMSPRTLLLDSLSRQIERDAETHRAQTALDSIHEMLERTRIRKDSAGRPVGKLDAEAHATIERIRETVKLSPSGVASDLQATGERIAKGEYSIEADETGAETLDELKLRLHLLAVFGDLPSKSLQELEGAAKELKRLVDGGRMAFEEKLREERERDERAAGEFRDQVTGGRELLDQAGETRAKEARKREFLAGLKAAWRRDYSFEWLLNSLVRLDKSSPTLSGAAQRMAESVHDATNAEESSIRERYAGADKARREIFGLKGVLDEARFANESEKLYDKTGVKVWTNLVRTREKLSIPEAARIVEDFDRHARGRGPAPSVLLDSDQIEGLRQQLRDAGYKGKRVSPKSRGDLEGAAADRAARIAENRADLNGADESKGSVYIERAEPGRDSKLVEQPLSQNSALYLWLMARQPDVRYKMRLAGWTPEAFAALDAFVKPEFKAWGDWMSKDLDRDWSKLNGVYKDRFGIDMAKSKNYFPAVYDKARFDADAAQVLDGRPGMASLNPGSLIARTHHGAEPARVSATDVYMRHVNQMEHFKAWAKPIDELNGVLSRRSSRKAVEQYVGEEAFRTLREYVQLMADGGQRAKASAILDFMRRNFAVLRLTYNIASSVAQIASAPLYATEIPLRDFAKLQAEFWGSPSENLKTLMESDYMLNRFAAGNDRDMLAFVRSHVGEVSLPARAVRAVNDKFIPEGLAHDRVDNAMAAFSLALRRAVEAGFVPMKFMDRLASCVAGWPVYEWHRREGLAKGMSEEEAANYAETKWGMATDRNMSSGHLKDLGLIRSGQSWERILTMFQTPLKLMKDRLAETAFDAAAGKKGAGKQLSKVAAMMFASGLLDSLVRAAIRNDWEREDVLGFLHNVFFGPFRGIFVAGPVLDEVAQIIEKGRVNGFQSIKIFEELPPAIYDAMKLWDGKDVDPGKLLSDLLEAGALASPTSSLLGSIYKHLIVQPARALGLTGED